MRFAFCVLSALVLSGGPLLLGEGLEFSVASFNVNNYRLEASSNRKARSEAARFRVAEAISFSRPDIVGLQEMGSPAALNALRSELARLGVEYPFTAFLDIENQEIQCALLSRFPILEDLSKDSPEFLLYGRELRVLRGVMELEIEISPGYHLRLINVHLKSRLPTWYADESDYRLAEAQVLRERIDQLLVADPKMKLVVVGDLNDSPDSRVLRTVRGKGRTRLIDSRPCEKNVSVENEQALTSGVSWTHHFVRRDGYFRYDYVLISPGLRRDWRSDRSHIPRYPFWQVASDHRLIVASFLSEE
jgi:endonuclease/exonuclease/phosphatase family metal-dependent hydrolase